MQAWSYTCNDNFFHEHKTLSFTIFALRNRRRISMLIASGTLDTSCKEKGNVFVHYYLYSKKMVFHDHISTYFLQEIGAPFSE